jgi:hypothetical protein
MPSVCATGETQQKHPENVRAQLKAKFSQIFKAKS